MIYLKRDRSYPFVSNQLLKSSIELKLRRAIAEPGGVIVSYDETGEPISIELLSASQRQLFNPQDLQIAIAT